MSESNGPSDAADHKHAQSTMAQYFATHWGRCQVALHVLFLLELVYVCYRWLRNRRKGNDTILKWSNYGIALGLMVLHALSTLILTPLLASTAAVATRRIFHFAHLFSLLTYWSSLLVLLSTIQYRLTHLSPSPPIPLPPGYNSPIKHLTTRRLRRTRTRLATRAYHLPPDAIPFSRRNLALRLLAHSLTGCLLVDYLFWTAEHLYHISRPQRRLRALLSRAAATRNRAPGEADATHVYDLLVLGGTVWLLVLLFNVVLLSGLGRPKRETGIRMAAALLMWLLLALAGLQVGMWLLGMYMDGGIGDAFGMGSMLALEGLTIMCLFLQVGRMGEVWRTGKVETVGEVESTEVESAGT